MFDINQSILLQTIEKTQFSKYLLSLRIFTKTLSKAKKKYPIFNNMNEGKPPVNITKNVHILV